MLIDLVMRIKRRLYVSGERLRHHSGLPGPQPGRSGACTAGEFRHPVSEAIASVGVDRFRNLFGGSIDAELVEGRNLLAHRFQLLGHRFIHKKEIDWHLDPVSGRDWPKGFSADIPYRGPDRLGDIKLPWELNKHQYFFTLGKAAWLLNDPAPCLEIIRQIDQWIETNPWYCGVNWISALEIGARAISWILAYPFYADYCEKLFEKKLIKSIYQHMIFVERHLSTGKYTNTHLVGEAAALVIGGLFLKCRSSRRWVKKGIRILEKEIRRQVSSDGVHLERSVAYHRFFLDQYFLVYAMLAPNDRSFSKPALLVMEQMTEYLMNILLPDGSAPALGDCDDARGLWFNASCPSDYRSLLALGAVLFERSDFKGAAQALSEEVSWLFGAWGLDKFSDLPARLPENSSAAYAEGGYYIMKHGWHTSGRMLIYDCGPLGHGPAGHGHSDALSFQLFSDGYGFVVDSGTFSYNLDYEWRDRFRSTRAHNTVLVDGQDQSVPADRMSWKTMAAARCNRWISTSWFDFVEGEHDGYRRLPDPVIHRRAVLFLKPDTWVVWDVLQGRAAHQMELLLHLLPGCNVLVNKKDGGFALLSPQGIRLNVMVSKGCGERVVPEILNGSDKELTAWWSPEYGVKMPARALRIQSGFSGDCSMITCCSSSRISDHTLKIIDGAVSGELKREGGSQAEVFYSLEPGGGIEREDLKFRGKFMCREKGSSQLTWAGGVRVLEITDVLSIRSIAPLESLEVKDNRCEIECTSEHIGDLQMKSRGIQIIINGKTVPKNQVQKLSHRGIA